MLQTTQLPGSSELKPLPLDKVAAQGGGEHNWCRHVSQTGYILYTERWTEIGSLWPAVISQLDHKIAYHIEFACSLPI